ncbi:glycosyltransferase [Clostridium fermenticellae]|uniref:Glycosyltransferase n=1 Tax=Clostridium fermenticellae TaxID=2068654 RepID=A0A386H2A3_9CLOT|nr:glycosyltransferase [Clostridium fermenticellae]AYD39784.1 glycosyltransferase [Clostridium fermenticellae]
MKKIVFFVKSGLDTFLKDIILELSKVYTVKKVIVGFYNQIDKEMKEADICWFEWCDDLVVYGSKLDVAKEKIIVCRLHSYEVFTNYINLVNWRNIDKLICVGKNICDILKNKISVEDKKVEVIQNGININSYNYKDRSDGINIAYVGYINFKKGPMLLIHTFKAMYEKNRNYKLYIAGEFQDERYVLYFSHMIKKMHMEKNIIYNGWQDDINQWLEDKNYILCTSVLESQNLSVMQAMSKGIKPVIHNFVGAEDIYPYEYLWNSIDEAVNMVCNHNYNSKEYRNFIVNNYSLDIQKNKILKLIDSLENN